MDAEGVLGSLSFPAVQSGEESSTGSRALHSEATVTHISSLQGHETTGFFLFYVSYPPPVDSHSQQDDEADGGHG